MTLVRGGAVAAYVRLADDCHVAVLGQAFGTKFLSFCPQGGEDRQALILDERVRHWLATNGRPDLDHAGWSTTVYAAYLEQAGEWASTLGCTSEEIEQLIFQAEADARGGYWAGPGPEPPQ